MYYNMLEELIKRMFNVYKYSMSALIFNEYSMFNV